MKTHAVRLAVGLATFAVGVYLAALMYSRPATTASPLPVAERVLQYEVLEFKSDCWADGGSEGKREETPEERAVRLAEEFVARNGYTDLPADRERLSYESVEWESNPDEMLKLRHDTLERKAFGLRYGGKMGGPGWTVAFRYNAMQLGCSLHNFGRAVTMDRDFQNLRVEHKDFPLTNVHKIF
jgi:hypothetical protein